jgi:hypothetical protein
MLVEANVSSSFFTKHTSPTNYFLHGCSRNKITLFGDGAHRAISWIGIRRIMFFVPFFTK